MTGRWIIDCGHDDWHAELHPYESVVSSHTEIGRRQEAIAKTEVVTSVVVTGAWPGGTLEFDIWPPPRPSATATLKWIRDRFVGIIDELTPQEELQPQRPDNPNHLHIKVVSTRPWAPIQHGDLNDVYYNTTRRFIAKYHLWWKEPPPVGPTAPPRP
jgi:hypothetical protein